MDIVPSDRTRPARPNIVARLLLFLTGIDGDTLAECPPADHWNVLAIALLMLLVWGYQASVLALVGHRLVEPDGGFNVGIAAGAGLIAFLIVEIDAHAFVRAGYVADGYRLLKQAGLDLTQGVRAKIAAYAFLGLRILLSLCFAMLTGIFTGLILFRADIDAVFDRQFLAANPKLIESARRHVEADIETAGDADKAARLHVAALEQQLAVARDGAIGPANYDAALRKGQNDVARAEAEKLQRDKELASAERYAANELAGAKGDASNSGVRGRGPNRVAAEERVQAARESVAAAEQAVNLTLGELDGLRKQSGTNADNGAKQAGAQLPFLQNDLAAAQAEAERTRNRAAQMKADRDQAIRNEVANSPDCAGCGRGLVAQLAALERISGDRRVAALILLIDATSFGLELAAVLAKVTVFIPTTYAALLARNSYMRVIEIVDAMDLELNRASFDAVDDPNLPPVPTFNKSGPHLDDTTDGDDDPFPGSPRPTGGPALTEGAKRPRGRPRKFAIS